VCVCTYACFYVYNTIVLVESRSTDDDDDDGYSAQIGDFRARGPTWPGTAIEGEGLILYDYCHHYCFVYEPSSWPSLTIINTYVTRPLTISIPLSIPFSKHYTAEFYRFEKERYVIIILYTIIRHTRHHTFIYIYYYIYSGCNHTRGYDQVIDVSFI